MPYFPFCPTNSFGRRSALYISVNIHKPDAVEIIWETKATLPEVVASLSWYEGLPAVWIACEFSDMRNIRRWLKDEKKLPHEQLYISSYWKKGRSEDQHKIEKRQDSEAFINGLGEAFINSLGEAFVNSLKAG